MDEPEQFALAMDSTLGRITLISDGNSLKELRIAGSCGDTGRFQVQSVGMASDTPEILREAAGWLRRYGAGERPLPEELRLAPEGTAFQQLVWRILEEIPWGETVTYGEAAREAARRLGKEKMSAQAIGGAVGRNPIPIVIPCHRVIAAGNRLGGFSIGTERKLMLLRHEGISVRAEQLRPPLHNTEEQLTGKQDGERFAGGYGQDKEP